MSESLPDLESDAPLLQDGAPAAGAEGAALTGEQRTLRQIKDQILKMLIIQKDPNACRTLSDFLLSQFGSDLG